MRYLGICAPGQHSISFPGSSLCHHVLELLAVVKRLVLRENSLEVFSKVEIIPSNSWGK